jgi:DNA-binding XRE family transcriptional regulator
MNLKSPIDQFVINKVKEKRNEIKLSQANLSITVGFAQAFVGHCENPTRRDKYNLQHLNELAKYFKCSIKDFLPDEPI